MTIERERFSPDELAVVLSHYDLGVIRNAKEFARGSRRSPKLLLRAADGRYLLKRRAAGRDKPERVEFAHALLKKLRQRRFPVPALVRTRDGQDSMLRSAGRTYELFEFMDGERYDEADEAANQRGLNAWPTTIIHGDWHPGNMLFRGGRVVVVLDFDSARQQTRIIDVANGLLQFSILRGSSEPADWPSFFDGTRMRRFLKGYLAKQPLSRGHREAIPHLMLESLIAESVVPIAATGSFGPMPGFGVLQMVRRKVRWLLQNRERLGGWLRE